MDPTLLVWAALALGGKSDSERDRERLEQGRKDREEAADRAKFWDNFHAEMDRKLGR